MMRSCAFNENGPLCSDESNEKNLAWVCKGSILSDRNSYNFEAPKNCFFCDEVTHSDYLGSRSTAPPLDKTKFDELSTFLQ